MPDNWGFVLAAYGLTAVVLGMYWRRLVRREHELRRRAMTAPAMGSRTAASHPRRDPTPGGRAQ